MEKVGFRHCVSNPCVFRHDEWAVDAITHVDDFLLVGPQWALKKVKESGTAGIISYALWELGFWAISVPICSFGFYEATGHWPNFGDKEDLAKLGAEAFAVETLPLEDAFVLLCFAS